MSYLSRSEYEDHLDAMSNTPFLVLDTEGTLNHPFSETWGFSYSVKAKGKAEYFAFNHHIGDNLPKEWVADAKHVIENHKCTVFHNSKHDLRAFRNLGINITGKFYDTMLMGHWIDENMPSKELDFMSRYYGGDPKAMPEAAVKIKDHPLLGWKFIPADLMRSYAANDAVITEELFYKLLPEFTEQEFNGELWDIEQKFIRLFCGIEDRGIIVDTDLSKQELERGTARLQELTDELGFNPGSPKQLGKFLLQDLGLPVLKRNRPTKKNPEGNPSFDKEAMSEYEILMEANGDHRAGLVLQYRGWAKTTSSNYKPYLELLHEDGRLRASYKLHGTKTGRLSCEKPNLQQIPKLSPKDWNGNLKKVFLSPPGYNSFECDYSQLEFRLSAAYANVKPLIDIFNDPTRDIFTEMSIALGMTRDQTKTLVYTIMYGGGVLRIMTVFKVSRERAIKILNNFFSTYPGFRKITKHAEQKCWDQRYLKYWTGRRRHFDKPYEQAHKAYNSVIQGGAFEIVKRQMLKADEAGLNIDECYMDLQVHDSVRFTILDGMEHIYIPRIIEVMEDAQPDFGVKFRVEVNKWGTKDRWDLAA